MTADWPLVTLGEIGGRGQYGYAAAGISAHTGYRLLRTTDIIKEQLDWGAVPFCEIDEETFAKYRLATGDLVISRMGSIGASAYIRDPPDAVFASYLIRFRVDPRLADARFVSYVLRSPDFTNFVAANGSSGSVQPNINAKVLSEFRFSIPRVEEQRAIASVLGALDDKIELNGRMSETLEALARAIFTSWFVDFDPVRAKADGRQPLGMDADTASLFPDSFEDSPLGPFPCGWQVVRLGSQIEVVRGLSYSGAGLTDADGGGLPLHNLNSIYEGGGYKYDGVKWYAGDFQERHLVRPGDVVVANTEQGFDRLLIGYPAIVPSSYGDAGLYSHHLYRLRPHRNSPVTARYLYLLLATNRYHSEVAGYANGTTINMLPIDALTRPWIALPPRAIVERFDELAAPILAMQEQSVRESVALRATRDALLPRLVSGEIRVSASLVASGN